VQNSTNKIKTETARKQKGLSQEQRAELVGYKVGTIAHIRQQ